MLIHDYAVSVLQCRNCEAPLPAKAQLGSPCPYCGAEVAEAREVGAFSHDIRVLVCESCAAPLPVPVSGGRVTCSYCQTSFDIIARRELKLGGREPADEAARLRSLCAQDRSLVLLPPELRPLSRAGGLVEETEEQATEMWRASRVELGRLRGSSAIAESALEAIERRLFLLTELLADYHNWKNRRVVARAFLEASLADLKSPRYVQPIYCWLARNAAVAGDDGAANDWLDLCDKHPDELGMDSALRFSWAVISMERRDFEGVLASLGESPAHVPLEYKYDKVAVLYRAHAIEMLRGADAGAQHLVEWTPGTYHAWRFTITMVQASASNRKLCPKSLELALQRRWRWSTAIVTLLVFLAGTSALIGDTFFGDRALGQGIYLIGIFWLLLGGGATLNVYANRKGLRRALARVRASTRAGDAASGDAGEAR